MNTNSFTNLLSMFLFQSNCFLDSPNDPIHDENNTLLASVAATNNVTLFFFMNV